MADQTTSTTAAHALRDLEADPITVAARMMLENHDALGTPGYDGALGGRCLTAAVFAAQAARLADDDAAPLALLRALLTALIDTLHPDLDYLRADPASGAAAREASNG